MFKSVITPLTSKLLPILVIPLYKSVIHPDISKLFPIEVMPLLKSVITPLTSRLLQYIVDKLFKLLYMLPFITKSYCISILCVIFIDFAIKLLQLIVSDDISNSFIIFFEFNKPVKDIVSVIIPS